MRRTNELYVDEVVRKQKLSLIGEMSNSLMHDLRNPLSGIRLASELITMIHSDNGDGRIAATKSGCNATGW